jgi:hypothetical protein
MDLRAKLYTLSALRGGVGAHSRLEGGKNKETEKAYYQSIRASMHDAIDPVSLQMNTPTESNPSFEKK